MKAVALTRYLPIDDPDALLDIDLPPPTNPDGHDVVIRIEAISVNPIDVKLRSSKNQVESAPKILGFDAAGIVETVGPQATSLRVGDKVYYAGDIDRPGSNAQYQCVDARIVGSMPTTLNFAQAAALPLSALTAWELLFTRMPYRFEQGWHGRRLLVIGAGGGVGSMVVQLAKLAGFTVIGTASRPESSEWIRALGAHHVIDHRHPLAPQLRAMNIETVEAVVNLADTDAYWDQIGDLIAPQGHVGLIVEPRHPLRIGDPYKAKCVGIHWEFMFARTRFKTTDMIEQQRILNTIAELVDAGKLRTTVTQTLTPINAENMRIAHRHLESGSTIGKIVVSGWE